MKSLHIICAKCGSTDIKVKIEYDHNDDAGVTFHCRDCGELTGIEEIQEQLDDDNKRYRVRNN